MKNKLILIFLVFVMLSVSAFGCGKKTENGGVIPLDIDLNNKPQMNVLLQATGFTNDQVNSDPNAKLIDELTGYKTTYAQLPATEDISSVNLALVNRSPYNVMRVTKTQYNALLANDALLDIKPALEKFGKDMLADINEYSWGVVTKGDGIYGIPEGGAPIKGQENVTDCIVFRKDLLWENGLDVPSTRDEFTEILRFFKQKYGTEYHPFTFNKNHSLIAPIATSFDIYQEWSNVNGKYTFYLEHPNYPAYMEYMTGLMNEGLIDLDVTTQDNIGAMNKMGRGMAVAYAGRVFEMQGIIDTMKANNLLFGDVEDVFGVVGGFLDSKGEVHTYHTGGYTYVNVIPKYMYETAAYTIDYLNKKIIDENFRRIYIGEKDVHYRVTNNGYEPILPAFEEKAISGFFLTGSNQRTDYEYWRCRVSNDIYRPFSIQLNKNADEEGVYNPLRFTNYLEFYDTVGANIEKDARSAAITMMFVEKSQARYNDVVKKWKNEGGAKGTAELNAWCEKNWEGKVKV